ncbi:MAG: aspartate/glutamate racemase family protein [Limnoraphis robusta]|uniref:Aspartate/glutamate racemase family protein n=1 Tax=Limnoraphis robusta CCNP1315 TaxID=3110306 RepID=A0ABU5U3Q1_9CYAN|nr:aspartate/glutamate racemase family protein [Limnoraphis robusta]MEA5498920.1 aspartate/glutamate racemase family protein [Limnoraphis robusta BA-68 BA1]MEA5521825.1 aspartate/glutamate racemase family protein [Limnoraphis robusta CCNP1315]MEA5540476.1 aspartate/glutamate racemase family protein [Limnoraphis robusta Tam1]MEA5543979.1 aspartate/glutamate racemase family protein [Limnoraphis robusta CCNP1324]
MIDQQRNHRINYIQTSPHRHCYGMGLGIIILDEQYPGFPGDTRNASAYPFPIQYEIAEGLDGKELLFKADKTPYLEPIQKAAKKLEKMGCRAIAGECGYFAYFQKEIAGYVNVPVFMSSLLQVPLAQQLIGKDKVVGILVFSKDVLTVAHLEAVGIQPNSNYVIEGMLESGCCSEITNLYMSPDPLLRGANYDKIEQELTELAVDFYQRYPHMGALLLECSGTPPFARAIQQAINLPVLSWGTLLDYAYSLAVHRDYYGHI